MRCYSKKCSELGLIKQFFRAYHRNHINKVMLTCFSGFAFEDSIENGGIAVKLGYFSAQSFKVAEKTVRESVRQPDGSMRQTGPVKRKKDDLYLVDCAVTGSSEGTAKDPKCCLKNLLKYAVFPEVRRLVGVGGKFEGYLPVWQGHSARPHVEANFLTFCWKSLQNKVG